MICTIVILSFGAFAIEQTRTASNHQQEELAGPPSTAAGASRSTSGADTKTAHGSAPAHEGSLHSALDEASDELTSPFAGLFAGSSSEWATRGAKLLLALALYGFGLGYLARVLRVRV